MLAQLCSRRRYQFLLYTAPLAEPRAAHVTVYLPTRSIPLRYLSFVCASQASINCRTLRLGAASTLTPARCRDTTVPLS